MESIQQIKCYCGHTDYCDCVPLEEPKQEYESECICENECRGFVNVKCKKPKQETLEEAAEKYVKSDLKKTPLYGMFNDTFIEGAKWQQERMYSEEDMKKAFIAGGNSCIEEDDVYGSAYKAYMKKWFEHFSKLKNG